MSELPEELRHLRYLIDSAKKNYSVKFLRDKIKNFADEASEADIIRMAEFILKRGTEIHWNNRN